MDQSEVVHRDRRTVRELHRLEDERAARQSSDGQFRQMVVSATKTSDGVRRCCVADELGRPEAVR
jgi:hypothetical protein